MAALIDTIGLVSGVLGIVSFFQDSFATTPGPVISSGAGATTVRVAAAKSGGGVTETKGEIGQINLYNDMREKIGQQSFYNDGDPSGLVRDGSFTDFSLDCQGQQPTYLQVFGREDAICIAYITHTWPDGTKRAWSGDIGALCEVSHWAYSNVIVGRTPDGNDYKPACTWLDWDHNTGITLSAMQIHISNFFAEDATNSTELSKEKFCNAPEMIWQDGHPHPTWGIWDTSYDARFNGVNGQSKQRRSIKKRSASMETQLVISNDPSHSATRLCQSDTSHSADFVSLDEGLFCDMGTKTLWPLCSASTTDNCFEKDDKTLIVHGERQVRDYQDVRVWK